MLLPNVWGAAKKAVKSNQRRIVRHEEVNDFIFSVNAYIAPS